ncbi:MAG: PQQ-binding-like beta-propeller repeat protein [Clostridiaceae bacterium]|nr:PQQ-binding-like beta-propeller repeat protein [Clostridiaceae bacterium]
MALLPACTAGETETTQPSSSESPTSGSGTAITTSQTAGTSESSPLPTSTPAPTSAPTPTPETTDPAKLAIALTDLPGYTAGTSQSDGSKTKTLPDIGKINWRIYNGSNQLLSADPSDSITAFGSPDTFTGIDGVLTFRGNQYRNAPAWGSADIQDEKLKIIWTKDIGAISGTGSYWPGAGWTGQPLLVHWPEETRQVMGISQEMKDKDLVEVFYPVFDGNIYCLDLETGRPTRDPIKVGFSFKGTGCVDPRGYPLFYAGQGLNDTNGHIGVFKYRIFDLIQNKEIYGIVGKDAVATHKNWGAFDSSALIDGKSDTLLEPGENGLFYKVKLNTQYDAKAGSVSIDPVVTKLRYETPINHKYGIESSSVAYRNLIYFSDNDGAVVCLDINTLEPVWVFNAGDDSDATMVLEETDHGVFLYQGNTIDHRGKLAGTANDICQLRKLNALTGELVWQYDVPCVYDSNLNGGLLATPLLGRGDFADRIIFNVCKTTSASAGKLLALDKESGDLIWERALSAYSWSSPISIQSKSGRSYGIFCDSVGIMHLFDPQTGKDIDTLSIGQNCEASPSAYNDKIVVATYAQKIYCIQIS